MAPLAIAASKLRPENFDSWTAIPGVEGRVVLKIRLDNFEVDTVLVIDANVSLEGYWEHMAGDSAQFAYALMDKDSNGIDIYFAGLKSDEDEDDDSPAGGFLNVSDPRFLLEAFQKVKDAGFSSVDAVPEVVDSIFKKYLSNYKPGNTRLNVIVWTDGTFDQDAFEASLVATAQALEKLGAPKTQIGIQLFRVGNVDGVADKFDYYDNELQAAHGLDRDLVDHTEYIPNGLTEEVITKVGAGAVEKEQDNA